MVRKSKKNLFAPEIYQTGNPDVRCTKLPEFIRAKMYLGAAFYVYFENGVVPDGTQVAIRAGNSFNGNAELKNNHSFVQNGVAEFKDLRFLGRSGRGKKFNVYIVAKTHPELVFDYPNAIKVTVDGPRPPRSNKNKSDSLLDIGSSGSSLYHGVIGQRKSVCSTLSSSSSCSGGSYHHHHHYHHKKHISSVSMACHSAQKRLVLSNLPIKKRLKYLMSESADESTSSEAPNVAPMPSSYFYDEMSHHRSRTPSGNMMMSSIEPSTSPYCHSHMNNGNNNTSYMSCPPSVSPSTYSLSSQPLTPASTINSFSPATSPRPASSLSTIGSLPSSSAQKQSSIATGLQSFDPELVSNYLHIFLQYQQKMSPYQA